MIARGSPAPLSAALLKILPFSHVTGAKRRGRKREHVLLDNPGQVVSFGDSQCAHQTYSDPTLLTLTGSSKVGDALKSAGEDGEKRAIRSGQDGTIIWGVGSSK